MQEFSGREQLYQEIHSCHICPSMDPIKALRRHEVIDASMDVFIVSQALAENTLRKSGVNFFTEEGEPGKTGRTLERFLEQFNRTVFPPRQIRLSSGKIVRKADSSRISVYNSEITQCYTRKKKSGKGDDEPKEDEIANCMGQNFLKREISLIKPKLILLMGDVSRKAFYKYFVGETLKSNLGEHLNNIVESGVVPIVTIEQVSASVLPIYHASVRDNSFNNMRKNEPLIRLIKGLLAQS